MSNRDVRPNIALLTELDNSIATFELGVEVYGNQASNSRYFPSFLLLSTSFERVMKIALHLLFYKSTGTFLTNTDLKRYGHQLTGLLRKVLRHCFSEEYKTRSPGKEDYDFLSSNAVFSDMLYVFSDFATDTRYVYMDTIAAPNRLNNLPESKWNAMKEKHALTDTAVIVHLRKSMCALGRLLAHSGLMEAGQVASPALTIFLQKCEHWGE